MFRYFVGASIVDMADGEIVMMIVLGGSEGESDAGGDILEGRVVEGANARRVIDSVSKLVGDKVVTVLSSALILAAIVE